MEDLPPVDSVGKLIACQLPVHYCGALYLEFQVFQRYLKVLVATTIMIYYYNDILIDIQLIYCSILKLA